jgi:hypothetical protein
MDEAVGDALELYLECRNGLAQHKDDPEALLKVVGAAENLAQAVIREESARQFIERLTRYLEDGQKAGDLSAHSVHHFISTEFESRDYISKPQGAERNKIIVLVNQHLKLNQRKLAKVCLTAQSTVSHVLSGDEIGAGNRGHGGARK